MKHRTERRGRRGSVIVLVVVAIGLMAFIGATYLQVARVQRQVVAEPVDNIDLVLQSVRQEIAAQLKEDIFDPATGNYFDVAAGIEPYDRAWTNDASTYDVFGIDGVTVVGQALGGDGDDTWLGSALPVSNNPGVWRWRKITTLTGGWYDTNGDASVPDRLVAAGVQGGTPPDRLVGGGGGTLVNGQDYNHDGFDPASHLVDADADGLGDSRWERAPIALKDGVEYFMAVRVIDLSAFLNANVATSAIDDSGAYDVSVLGDDAPRAQQPGEIDLGRFVFEIDGTGGFMNELNGPGGLLDERGVSPAAARPLAFDGVRRDFWEAGPRNYLNFQAPAVSLTATDEAELRHRMGTVELADVTTVLETAMPNVMTRNVPGAALADVTDVGDFYTYGEVPRAWLTVSSGEALFAPTLPGETPTTRVLRYPLNQPIFEIDTAAASAADRADLTTALGEVSAVVQAVYGAGNPPNVPTTVTTPAELGDQFAASLQDYRDADNRITQVGTRYGLEALPFIAEVYTQRRYTATAQAPRGMNFDITWTADAGAIGDGGFAVELRNPFNRPIRLDNVTIWVNDGAAASQVGDGEAPAVDDVSEIIDNSLTGGSPVEAYNNAQGRADDPRTAADERQMLWPGDVLVIYRNSGSVPSGGGPADDIRPLIDTSAGNVIVAELPPTAATNVWSDAVDASGANDTFLDISVELRGVAADGTPLTVPYQTAPAISLPDEYVQEDDPAPHFTGFATPGTPDSARLEADHTGNDEGLHLLTRVAADFDETVRQPDPFATVGIDTLGEAKPSGTSVINGATNQLLIADDEDNRLHHVGELAQVAILGFDAAETVPDKLGSTFFQVDTLFLGMDTATNPVIDNTEPAWNLPHAQFLLGRFTTLSPQRDGLDNDNDADIDEDGEQKLLGRLNLNTAGEGLLADVLPYADAALRAAAAADAVTLRGDTSLAAPPAAGIAQPWQMWDGAAMESFTAGGFAGNDTQGAATRYDFRQNYEFTLGTLADNVADDREERNQLLAMLGQVTTTRSDVYVAYVLVHGYDSNNFAAGPVEVGREIVLFDRTGLITNDDAVVTSVLYRFP